MKKSIEKIADVLNINSEKESYILSVAKKQGFAGTEKEILGAVIAAKKAKEKAAFEKAKQTAKKAGFRSVKELKDLTEKAKQILSSFSTGHSMGCYKYLTTDKYTFCDDDCQTYAKSCTWKATYGSFRINMSLKQLRAIEKIEGIWTLKGKDNRATWLLARGNKYTYAVEFCKGFLVGTSHGCTLEDAERLEALKQESLKRIAINEAEAAAKKARFIGIDDVRKMGACEAGIEAFCRQNNLIKDFGYNVAYLLTLPGSKFIADRI